MLLNKFGRFKLITYLYTMKIFKIKEYGKHEFHSIADQHRAEKKAFAKARNKRKRK